jgi:iron complex outermembrane recepter protein
MQTGKSEIPPFRMWTLLIVGVVLLFSPAQTKAASSFAFQDTRPISGTITDAETGEPIAGATVVIRGTNQGTTTDANGRFTLQATVGAVLEISFVGYQPATLVVSTANSYTLSLSSFSQQLSDVVVVGSRNQNRTVVDSPVPVDVIDVSNLASTMGKVEINQILQYAAPSFNATKQSGSDGADHIDPASLRGLGPDQTLVLINGKRRHQSSLVNIFGTRGRGNSGTDLNAIPSSAIKRIEILRDGASAQYGSDAIAGVINIVLKDNAEGVTGGITYGAYSTAIGSGWEEETGESLWNVEGKNRLDGKDRKFDGNTFRADLNAGLKLGDKGGFANLTAEILSKDRTLRPGFSWRKGYGTAAVDGINFMVNSGVPLGKATHLYIFGGTNFRKTDAYAFSRESFDDGDNRSVPSLYPNGFTPHITSDITDVAVTAGVRHKLGNDWKADLSNTFGRNNFHYRIKGTNNASMQEASPTEFDAGGHNLAMNVTNLDVSRYYSGIAAGFNLAFGSEFRVEQFKIFAGEVGSYALYDDNGVPITDPSTQTPAVDSNGDELPGGAQGFPGYSPENEVNESRANFALYTDAELNVTDDFMISGALRFENYSDFGSTFNGKLATRYNFSEVFSVRGSFSTGFRAPSLAQIHYNLIFNNIVAGESVPTLLSSNTSPVTRAFGIGPLQEETAVNGSAGLTIRSGGFTATIDAYSITVKNRIVLTDNFDASDLDLGVDAAQFFANGVDTKTTGMDIVLAYNYEISNNSKLNVGLSGNFNKLKIEKIHNGALNEYIFFGPFSQAYLKAAAPDYKLGAMVGYTVSKFTANLFLTQFSKVILQDFQWVDEAGDWVDDPVVGKAKADDLYSRATDIYKSVMTVDLSLSYQFTPKFSLTIGGNNIFNKYATPQFDAWTDQGGLMDSVQMGSDGAYFFGRIGFRF